jgi:hypothetical protein
MRNLRDGNIFESEVRRIARALWPTPNYSGPTILDGLERDAIFVTEDVVYYVEATISKSEAKAIEDIRKLFAGADKLRKLYPNHLVQAVFVTLDDPTGHQGVAIENARGRVRHYTFDQLRARLVDARAYLAARNNYPFGSVRDPATDAPNVPEDAFVQPTLFVKGENKPKRYLDIARSIEAGKQRYVILGDFGVGKSMLLKHIYLYLASQTLKNNDHKFPVLLNLRDHREQTDPAEALSRHATRLGLDNPAQLVRAWRAGYGTYCLMGLMNCRHAQRPKKRREFETSGIIRSSLCGNSSKIPAPTSQSPWRVGATISAVSRTWVRLLALRRPGRLSLVIGATRTSPRFFSSGTWPALSLNGCLAGHCLWAFSCRAGC